ncbi:MAG: RagB/SusD family nutrient uptake outer membrane protein, partial [Pedobacter sp.]
NLYGDVPLILTSDYEVNSKIGRTSRVNVYKQIESDLTQADLVLDNTYVAANTTKSSTDRLRPNKATVNALQARVYLYQKKYSEAEVAATKVIEQSTTYSFSSLDNVFLANSSETIWALQPVTTSLNTWEGFLFILPSDGPNYDKPFFLSPSLMDSFEPGDNRKNAWVGSVTINDGTDDITYSYPAKYKTDYIDGSKDIKEYTIVFRLAEQYLIRAEAKNEQGNTGGAAEDLNALRNRSRADMTFDVQNPLPAISSTLSKDQMSDVIMHERRVELFTEWGHRWFDLKRSPTLDAVMAPATAIKGGIWANYKALYPIPLSDILLNPAITQNPGYSN